MSESDPAAARFWTLQAMRLLGLVMVVIGATIVSGRLLDSPDFGYVLLVLGAIAFFLLPVLVKRRWRSRGE